jgi:type IV secretory pathway VirB4 component
MYLLENPTFERMFSNPRSKLDLYTELQSSKVILINTDKDLLKDKRTEMFGRFFIAMLLQSAQERAALQRENRLPVFCYIDECHDYIANDTNITTLLDQARKMNIGLVLANQRCAQVSPAVLDALCNVSIKMARALSDSDAHTLARNMQTTPAVDFH